MGTLWRIALRNTLRHKRRTIITAIVMTAGIACFISFDSIIAGMDGSPSTIWRTTPSPR